MCACDAHANINLFSWNGLKVTHRNEQNIHHRQAIPWWNDAADVDSQNCQWKYWGLPGSRCQYSNPAKNRLKTTIFFSSHESQQEEREEEREREREQEEK